ncbi:hypothetical protein C5N14_27165 [Micromonospora sp. MW-13]|nr:hypothetical protein C5N14_27165 [Micromonospora sp. MW-13]
MRGGEQDRGDREPAGRRGGVRRRLGGRGLLQDEVGVGAAHAEGRDGRPPDVVVAGPREGGVEQGHRPRRPVDVRGRLCHVQGGRQHAVPHRHHHLDDAAGAGGGLGVADVRLQGPQPQRTVGRPALAVGGQQRLRLDRVAEPGAGAVRLHDVDVGRRQPGVLQRLPDDPLLGGAVGGGQAAAGAVLVDGAAADHREDGVAVAPGVGELLDEQQGDALGPAGAVGVGRERLAPAVGGEPALPGELDEGTGGGQHGHAAGHREGALAVPQRLAGQVQGHQGGRAGGVDRDGRSLQAEGVRQPARHDARRGAGEDVPLGALGQLPQDGRVVLAGRADEDAGAAAPQRRGVDAGPLEDLPGHLQQEPLLRVHGQRLARRDPEQGRVEQAGVCQEAAPVAVGGALVVRVRVVEPVQVPAPVLGERAGGVHAPGDQVPQVLGRGDPAGEPAGHADDRDRLRILVLQLAQAPARQTELGGHPLQVFEELVFVRHDPPAQSLLSIRICRFADHTTAVGPTPRTLRWRHDHSAYGRNSYFSFCFLSYLFKRPPRHRTDHPADPCPPP